MIWYTILFYAICVQKIIPYTGFPLNTVHLYTISNLLINVLLLGQNFEKKIHNGSNTWPDFHNNI